MKEILQKLLNHEFLTREEMKRILIGITMSEFPNEQITALLTALQMRGVTVEELLGFRDGILETGVPAILSADRDIDVVGTGGDRKNTFNISTTACFVIAGAGYKVAKHGNYAATSVSGASNVIQHHGIRFTDDIDRLNRSLDEAGIWIEYFDREMSVVKADLGAAKTEYEAVTAELEQAKADVESGKAKAKKLQGDLTTANDRVTELETAATKSAAKVTELEGTVSKRDETIKSRAAAFPSAQAARHTPNIISGMATSISV